MTTSTNGFPAHSNRHKIILQTFSSEHVIKLTREGKALIDHIRSNISTKLIHWMSSALMKFQNTINHLRYSISKSNNFKNDTIMFNMRQTSIWVSIYCLLNNYQLASSMHLWTWWQDLGPQKFSESMYIWTSSYKTNEIYTASSAMAERSGNL